jgi:hypothetical protein
MRAELAGLGWFLIVGVPLIVVLQQTGVFPGPKPSLVDLLGCTGFLLGGVALVTLSQRDPSRAPRVRHCVRAERGCWPRYQPVCSCGWQAEGVETVEEVLLLARGHKREARVQAALESGEAS